MSCRHVLLRILFALLLFALALPMACAAQQAPPPRAVDLPAPDGVILKATFFAAAQPGPGVLLLHQCNRQRKVWDDLAARLAASGINVMTMDFRGYGESGGKGPDKVSSVQEADQIVKELWPADVDLAFRYLQTQPNVNRGVIGAGGASCGVNQAVQLARRHPEVKSLVLLSETTDRSGRQFLHNSPDLPLFLAAADDDVNDPGVVEIMQWLYDVSPDPANKFVHYSVGGHGADMFAAHPELPGMIVDWFNATLRNSPEPPVTHALAPWSPESKFLALADEPDGMRKAEQMFVNERRADPSVVLFSEALINRFGYEHLAMGDTKVAIELFQMNVTAYPNSPNVYDSLGDAYLAAGQKDLARAKCAKGAGAFGDGHDGQPAAPRWDQRKRRAKVEAIGQPRPITAAAAIALALLESPCYLLCYHAEYVIISRGLISSRLGGHMANAARGSARRAATPPSPIQSLAKHNRTPPQLAENKHRRPKSIASFCRFLALTPRFTSHNSPITPFLFDTNERTRKKANLFTTNKKRFLFRTFERFLPILFKTFEQPAIYPLSPTKSPR